MPTISSPQFMAVDGLSASQIGLGLPASPPAAGSGYVSPALVNSALDCLAAKTNCGSGT